MLIPLEYPSISSGNHSGDWIAFEKKLTSVLAKLKDNQYLVLPIKSSNQFIQFAAQGEAGMRIEATSNHYLTGSEKLTKKQIATLIDAGWRKPTNSPQTSTAANDPHGSPNFFVDIEAPIRFEETAKLAVTTLANVFHIPDTTYLHYSAFDKNMEPIFFPELDLPLNSDSAPDATIKSLKQEVLEVLRDITGVTDLEFDSDEDLAVSYKDMKIFVRLIENGTVIRIYSPILAEVDLSEKLLIGLNELNGDFDLKFVRYVFKHEAIFLVAEVPGSPLVKNNFIEIFDHFCKVADKMGTLLQNQLALAITKELAESNRTVH